MWPSVPASLRNGLKRDSCWRLQHHALYEGCPVCCRSSEQIPEVVDHSRQTGRGTDRKKCSVEPWALHGYTVHICVAWLWKHGKAWAGRQSLLYPGSLKSRIVHDQTSNKSSGCTVLLWFICSSGVKILCHQCLTKYRSMYKHQLSWFSGTISGSWRKVQFTPCHTCRIQKVWNQVLVSKLGELYRGRLISSKLYVYVQWQHNVCFIYLHVNMMHICIDESYLFQLFWL